jgi:hypothetical protein
MRKHHTRDANVLITWSFLNAGRCVLPLSSSPLMPLPHVSSAASIALVAASREVAACLAAFEIMLHSSPKRIACKRAAHQLERPASNRRLASNKRPTSNKRPACNKRLASNKRPASNKRLASSKRPASDTCHFTAISSSPKLDRPHT